MTLYNKYRPKNFDDLVHSKFDDTVDKKSIFNHHAYLLFGPPGCGKTSTARLAMSEFRPKTNDDEKLLNQCISGLHPDYVEVNCAVNNGVDDIRGIIADTISLMPVQCSHKFIIFDECLDYGAKIELSDGTREKIGKIVKNKLPVSVISYNFQKKCFENKKVINWFQNSKKEVYDWKFKSTKNNKIFTIRASENHKIFDKDGKEMPLKDVCLSDSIKVVKRTTCNVLKKAYDYKTRKFHISDENDFSSVQITKENHNNDNLYELIDATYVGKINKKLHGKYTYDIEVEENHNYLANFVLVHNCHMLTPQAQNALLKIVEEPPKQVKFFFCTTEINKVLPAIRSRCQIIPFLKLSDAALKKVLINVCKKEELVYSEESLQMIASSSDGSARTAINLLEQCLGNIAGKSILADTESVGQILGTANINDFHMLTSLICDKKRSDCVSFLQSLLAKSNDPNNIINKYADYIAELIVLRINSPTNCEFEGKKLMVIADCVTEILKDFKTLQNIKLISIMHILKAIDKIGSFQLTSSHQ